MPIRIIKLALLVLAMGFIFGACSFYRSLNHIDISINNSGSSTLTDLKLEIRENVQTIRILPPGEKAVFRIKPSTESDIIISYLLGTSGARVSQRFDVSISSFDYGSAHFDVNGGGQIKWTNNIKVIPAWYFIIIAFLR